MQGLEVRAQVQYRLPAVHDQSFASAQRTASSLDEHMESDLPIAHPVYDFIHAGTVLADFTAAVASNHACSDSRPGLSAARWSHESNRLETHSGWG